MVKNFDRCFPEPKIFTLEKLETDIFYIFFCTHELIIKKKKMLISSTGVK